MPSGETKGSSTKTSHLLLLNPKDVTIAQFGLPSISVNEWDFTKYWSIGAVGYRIMCFVDVGLARPSDGGAYLLKNIKEVA